VIVADASVVAALVLPRAQSELVEELQRADASWVAPPLVLSELRSIMASLVRHHMRTPVQGSELFVLATEALEAVTFEPDARRVMELVAGSGCSSYDCEYVAVAEELACPLATFDAELMRAFPTIAVHPERLLAGDRSV
jgi:predicted nucleic acid-binding protein